MPCLRKKNPVGLDLVIDKRQWQLFKILELCDGWRNYDSWARAYRNRKGDELLPEVVIGNGEYREVLFDDKETVNSFFLVGEKRLYNYENGTYEQDLSIIFQARLDKLYPKVCGQADEELINTVRIAIKKMFWDNRLVNIITGVDNVYSGLNVKYDKKYYDNMSGYCVVRFDFKVLYTNDDNPQEV